jgi:hypothetical protein
MQGGAGSPFDAAAALRYLTSAREAHDRDERTHWAITTDGQQARGEVLLNRATGSIGYILGAAHRGQRLAARALRAVAEYANTALDLPRLMLEIEPDNQSSIAVARSAASTSPAFSPRPSRTKDGPTPWPPGNTRPPNATNPHPLHPSTSRCRQTPRGSRMSRARACCRRRPHCPVVRPARGVHRPPSDRCGPIRSRGPAPSPAANWFPVCRRSRR